MRHTKLTLALAWSLGCASAAGPSSIPSGGDRGDGGAHPGDGADGGAQPAGDAATEPGDGAIGERDGSVPPAPPPFMPPSIQTVRAPAYPLVASDPYFSIWSFSDKLCDTWPRHWTGAVNALASLVRVDGKAHRLMGLAPDAVPCAEQTSVRITPTRTVYAFETDGVEVRLSFLSPTLPDDLELLSRSVGYVTWDVRSTDGASHDVQVYFDNSAELTVNEPGQEMTWDEVTLDGVIAHRMGTTAQPVLAKKGDDLRIDWGHVHQAAVREDGVSQVVASDTAAREGFASSGTLPPEDTRKPRLANDGWPVIATAFTLEGVSADWSSRTVLLAYDDEYAIELMGARLRPYWRKDGATASDLIARSLAEYPSILERAQAFDAELVSDLEALGGASFMRLSVLSYRQAFAAHKLVAGLDGTPLFFSKENFSNGCIATVDVTYPSAPLFLLLNPALLKGMLTPIADYATSARWRFDFAPHDLGTYPLANGQVYGGGEGSEDNQMPVEESANMMLLFAALAKAEGDTSYATKYAGLLAKWAAYLEVQGFDPASQLSTDDFAGHLAHNVNLSAKAILALGAYAQLIEGQNAAEAARVRGVAQGFASEWVTRADDGDHTRLAFDAPGTWSQKYNLVWDRILGLNLFPAATFTREAAYMKTQLRTYGVPLDNRRTYTKLDWTVWTATLSGDKADFDALVSPLMAYLDASGSRVPLSDWYETTDANQVGFQARSVVGGVFLPALYDGALWQKWVSRSR